MNDTNQQPDECKRGNRSGISARTPVASPLKRSTGLCLVAFAAGCAVSLVAHAQQPGAALRPSLRKGVPSATIKVVPSSAVRAPSPDPNAAPVPDYNELIAKLGAESATERERASALLAGDSSFTSKQLEATLRTATLSAEQRYRLLEASKQRFMSTTRAAMGVQQFPRVAPERVIIGTTYPQFPSFKVLREGDMIIEAEGEKLRSYDAWNRLGAHIVSHDPGGTMEIVVRRGEEKLTLHVELGSYKDLPGPSQLDVPKLERAWQLRSESFTRAKAREPIAVALPAGKWDPGMESAIDQKLMRLKMQLRPRIIAGGDARGGELDYDEVWNGLNNNGVAALDQRMFRNAGQPGMVLMDFGGTTMTIAQEIAALEQTRDQLKAIIQREGLPGNKPQNRGLVDMELGLTDGRKSLTVIEQTIKALNAEAADMKEPDKPAGQIPPER